MAPALALWRPAVGGVVAGSPYLVTQLDAAHMWPLALFASLVLTAAAATWRSHRAAFVLTAVAVVPPLGYGLGRDTILVGFSTQVTAVSILEGLVVTLLYAAVAAAALGLGTWMRSSYLTTAQAAALAGRAGAVERESAVVGERARLARDLHDVVAHHVSLIAVRAETAPYTLSDLSPGATELLTEIADDSRRALDELRGVLGILGRSTGRAGLAPQPGAADIAGLVEAARRGRDDVDWAGGDVSAVAAAPGYVAYRVVQEALTNARRHAPGVPVRLEVVPVGRGVLVRVENATHPDGALDPVEREVEAVVEGHGLAGMRERVEALGGTLAVAVVDDVVRVEAAVPGDPGRAP